MAEYSDKSKKRSKPNYFYSIISVALVLFILGLFGLVILHAQKLIIVLKERLNIIVEIKETALESEIENFQIELEELPFVKAGSPSFISKDEAAILMREEFGDDFLQLDLPNPFYNVVTFNVNARYLEQDSLKMIKEKLQFLPVVQSVIYQEDLAERISKNIQRLGLLAFGIAVFSIFIAVTLIHNTIRLALYSNRFLIKNMQLVGASWEFISRPYIRKAILHGIISSVIALIGLAGIMYWLWENIPEIRALKDITGYTALAVLIVVMGILINSTSTYFVVNKYLKMRIDDLY